MIVARTSLGALVALVLSLLPLGCGSRSGIEKCVTSYDCPAGEVCGAYGRCTAPRDGRAATRDGGPIDQPVVVGSEAGWDYGPWWSDAEPWYWDLGYWPDTSVEQCVSALVGKPCTMNGGECGGWMTCILTSEELGFCTCECTPDNEGTPLANEDSCPDLAKHRCATVELTSGSVSLCLRTCNPKLGANDCQSPLACKPEAGASFGLWEDTACVFKGCSSNADCPVLTGAACSVAKKDCPSPARCLSFDGGDEGRCALDGKCDLKSGLCTDHAHGKPGAKIGDPCKGDMDCGGNMSCTAEYDETVYLKGAGQACADDADCCSGTCGNGACAAGDPCRLQYRNGYCTMAGCSFAKTLTSRACPGGSSCNTLYAGGTCQLSCDLTKPETCRGYSMDKKGDYECRAWQNLGLATTPVCDYGLTMHCSAFEEPTGMLSCANLGVDKTGMNNVTKMVCRSPEGTVLGNWDPTGYCYDNTSSGN